MKRMRLGEVVRSRRVDSCFKTQSEAAVAQEAALHVLQFSICANVAV